MRKVPTVTGTQKSLVHIHIPSAPVVSWTREESGEGLFLAQAVLGSSPRCPLTPPTPGGEARVPGFSLQTRGACQAPCQTPGACGAGLGTGDASPRAPARCAAATQRHSRAGSDAMAGSESPREGPGSAARSGRTPAGLAAAGAEGGGGTRPQAPPGPAPPRSRPGQTSLPAVMCVSHRSGRRPLGAFGCASAFGMACAPGRRLEVPASSPLRSPRWVPSCRWALRLGIGPGATRTFTLRAARNLP